MREKKNIKVNVNMFDDTKLKIIDTKPERDMIHYIWFRMMTLAGKVDRDGELYLSRNIPYTVDTLAVEFNRSIKDIEIAVNVLIDLEMIGFTKDKVFMVLNYSKHQNGGKKKTVNASAECDKSNKAIENKNSNTHEEIGEVDEQDIISKTEKDIKVSSADEDKKINSTKLLEETCKDDSDIAEDKDSGVKNKVRSHMSNEKIIGQKSNIENLNEYINKKSSSKPRKSRKKKKEENDIKCVNSNSDLNEEFITFYDGEIPIIDGEVIKSWHFTE